MAVTITDVGGVTTINGRLDVKNDLKTQDDLTVTGHLVVSGDVHIEDGVTELDATPVRNRFSLVIPGIPLAGGTVGYTVAPCNLNILSVYSVNITTTTGSPILTLTVAGVAHGETVALAGGFIGDVTKKTFTTPDTALDSDNISIEATSVGTGTANIILICEQT